MLKPARAKESSQETVAPEVRRDSGVVPALSTGPEPAGEPPRALRALTVDLDILEDSFSDGALCFLNPLNVVRIYLPRRWQTIMSIPGSTCIACAEGGKAGVWLVRLHLRSTWTEVGASKDATGDAREAVSDFVQRLNEREEVQWSAYCAARCGMELRSWLEGVGIRAIPRRSGRRALKTRACASRVVFGRRGTADARETVETVACAI